MLLLLEILNLLLKALDDLLAEMRALRKLFLNFFVNFDIALKRLYLSLHLVVLEQELFSLLRLILKLGCQLMVLQNCQASCGLKLFIVKSKQVSFGLLDLVKHVLSELFSRLDLLSLFLVNLTLNIFKLNEKKLT